MSLVETSKKSSPLKRNNFIILTFCGVVNHEPEKILTFE